MSDYIFPELFVKNVESKRIICRRGDEFTMTSQPSDSCSEIYGSIPYEDVLRYIDLENPALKASIILVDRRELPKALLFEEGTPLCLQEVTGRRLYYIGGLKHVRRGELVVYTVTGKHEVRSTRSVCEGFLLAVIDLTWEKPEKIVLVVSVEQPREISIRESERSSF
ncbi:MAG: DUF2118 domain-containing protein [Desulfurococcus sp.]|nr:DUF2118 domain-containing protein [Desulfurococcus sp.]